MSCALENPAPSSRFFLCYSARILFLAAVFAISTQLLWWVLAGLVVTPLTTLILTMNNSPGNHALQVSLQSTGVTAIVVGGVLRVIAGVMEDGRRLKDEMELII